MENRTLIKKFFSCFGLAFIFVFVAVFLIEIIPIIAKNGASVSGYGTIIVIFMPGIFIMSILFSACIGLTQFFIAIDVVNINNKKLMLLTLFLGIFFAVINYLIFDLSVLQADFALHKKYSLSAGTFTFAFFALTVALLFQHKKIVGLVVSIISCILYWSLLAGGESLAIKLGKNGIINVWFPTLLFAYLTINFYLVHELFKMHKKNLSQKDENAEYNDDYSI